MSNPPRPNESFSVSANRRYETLIGDPNPTYSILETEVPYVRYVRNWTGTRTPGFGKLKRTRLPINGHTVDMFNVRRNSLIEYFRWPVWGKPPEWPKQYSTLVTTFTEHYNPPAQPDHIQAVRSLALRNLIRKAGNEMESNLALGIAEIGQITRMIGNTVGRVTGSMTALRRGNLSGAAGALFGGRRPRYRRRGGLSRTNSVAQNWLELQYGWKPLLSDLNGLFEALGALNTTGIYERMVTASATREQFESIPITIFQANPVRVVGQHIVRTRTTYKFGMRFRIDSPLVAFMAQTGFTNPINLAWEVLPFSFVADWFLPIGPWLETLSAWHGLSFLDGYEVRFTRQEVASAVSAIGGNNFQNGYLDTSVQGDYQREWLKFERVKLTTFPTPSFPSFRRGMNTTRTANAIALMRVLFR